MVQTREGVAFRNALNRYCEDNRLTVAQFAEFLGYPHSTVKKWFAGYNFPSRTRMSEIAEKLGLTMNELTQGMKHEDVDINRATGLSPAAIATLRDRNSVMAAYVATVIEPMIQRENMAYDLVKLAALKRGQVAGDDNERDIVYTKQSLIERFTEIVDAATQTIEASTNNTKLVNDILNNPRLADLVFDFHSIVPFEEKGDL